MAANSMTEYQKDLLLAALMHYLPMDVRHNVMHDVPDAYNAYVGRPVVRTTVTTDL